MGKNSILLLFFLLMPPTAQGATIQGTIYEWYYLEPLGNVIVEVNSTPPQQVVAKAGSYSLSLPEGDYQISARHYQYGVLKYYAEENITIRGEGNFTLDLIMLPALEEERLFAAEGVEIGEILAEEEPAASGFYLGIIIALALAILIILYRGKAKQRELSEAEIELPEDLSKLLDVIKQSGGRVTQVELRKKLPYGEAKISLMLADLEERGLIKKIKKGRGNIIILL